MQMYSHEDADREISNHVYNAVSEWAASEEQNNPFEFRMDVDVASRRSPLHYRIRIEKKLGSGEEEFVIKLLQYGVDMEIRVPLLCRHILAYVVVGMIHEP